MRTAVRHVLGPDEGEAVRLMALGVRFMIDGETTNGAFSLVEHPLPPRALGAPLHTHRNEDEYSYVLEGRVGVQLGDEVLEAVRETSSSSRAACPMLSGTRVTSLRASSS